MATDGGSLYASVRELVPRLAERWPLMIVSNCQTGYIQAFLSFSELGPHFVDHECWGNTGRPKAANLADVIARNRLQRPVFVGDTQGDCDAALLNACPFVHASYRFGTASSADARIASFAELPAVLTH